MAMRHSPPTHLRFERASALILLVFAGGAILDALLRASQLVPGGGLFALLLSTVAVPVFISSAVWIALRFHKELSGACFIQLIVSLAAGVAGLASTVPMNWYLAIGLILWSMRLGQSLLMWVGTSLLVLALGAQLGVIDSTGTLYLPFVMTVPAFLGVAAYFQWHQVRAQAQDVDLDAAEKSDLHLKRYGRLPNE